MPILELTPADLAQVKTLLQRWVPQAEVWAYGSRVNGNSHDASDLDLVVLNPKSPNQPTKHVLQLKQALRDSHLVIMVDLMDWAYLPESYRHEIMKRYVIIQA